MNSGTNYINRGKAIAFKKQMTTITKQMGNQWGHAYLANKAPLRISNEAETLERSLCEIWQKDPLH